MISTESHIRCEPVSFDSNGARLSGNLFVPGDAHLSAGLPAVIVTGTWTSIKEQMADRYAALLAGRGLAALSFDFTGFGSSEGDPRDVESAKLKIGDIQHAATFLQAHPLIDADRIGSLAICASAMYAALAAASDSRLRALALVAPWIHDAELVREVYGGDAGVRDKLEAADRAAERYARTGEVEYVPVADASNPRAAMPMEVDFYISSERGALPGWPNRFAVMAWREWLTLDVIAQASKVTAPTLIVHSTDAAIPPGAQRFQQQLGGWSELVWMPGGQFDFYDQPATVDCALARVVPHFENHLKPTQKRSDS